MTPAREMLECGASGRDGPGASGGVLAMRICFLGDSFVNGTGDPDCLGWVGRVCASARRQGRDLTSYNLGVRRETSADIAARWREEVARRLPAGIDGRLVFSFGVNDTTPEGGRPRVPLLASLANARAMLGEAAGQYPTLMVGPPPVAAPELNLPIARLSAGFAVVCAEIGVPYLDIHTPLSSSPVWMGEVALGDGSHPGAGGYALLAGEVQRWAAWRAWLRDTT